MPKVIQLATTDFRMWLQVHQIPNPQSGHCVTQLPWWGTKLMPAPRAPAWGKLRWTSGPHCLEDLRQVVQRRESSLWHERKSLVSRTRACSGPESGPEISIRAGWWQRLSGNMPQTVQQQYILKARERHCPAISSVSPLFYRLTTRLTGF